MQCHKCNAEIADSAILCDACGAVVKTAPKDAPLTATEKRCRRINLRRLLAFAVAIAMLLAGIGGILLYNSPDAVAKRFVQAYLEGDFAQVMALSAGDMRALLENETDDTARENLFQRAEATAAELGLDVTVDSYDRLYDVMEQVVAAAYAQIYGDDYTITMKVKESEEMGAYEFNVICASYVDDTYAAYVDVDRLKIGKYVTVAVTIDGTKATNSFERVLPMVQYKGQWRVVINPYILF